MYTGDTHNGNIVVFYHGPSYQSQVSFNDGKWHMLTVVTYENGTSFYLDGAFAERCDFGSNTSFGVEGLWLGAEQDSVNGSWDADQHLKGSIDEISIFSRCLSASEVNMTYKASIGKPPVWAVIPTQEAV